LSRQVCIKTDFSGAGKPNIELESNDLSRKDDFPEECRGIDLPRYSILYRISPIQLAIVPKKVSKLQLFCKYD
jgi:hypothetical protein